MLVYGVESLLEMYHIEGGCVAPADVSLVVGSGHIYEGRPSVFDYTKVFWEILNHTLR